MLLNYRIAMYFVVPTNLILYYYLLTYHVHIFQKHK